MTRQQTMRTDGMSNGVTFPRVYGVDGSFELTLKRHIMPQIIRHRNVKSVKYNWHQVGSTCERDGAGDDWERVTVGEKGVIRIHEDLPKKANDLWNYLVEFEDGTMVRIFNPNFVEYFAPEPIDFETLKR